MKIYHYSGGDYPTLQTLNKQNAGSKSALPDGTREEYANHISFFFEPAPLDILGGIFGKDHKAWFPGAELIEYTIDVSSIGDFRYEIVESPEKTKLYYDDSISIVQYHKLLAEVNQKHHYVGRGADTFIKACKPLLGGTRKAYMELPHRKNFKELRGKYAATVPHVMLYPDSGEVSYQSKKHVRVK